MIKLDIVRGDISDISAKKASLALSRLPVKMRPPMKKGAKSSADAKGIDTREYERL